MKKLLLAALLSLFGQQALAQAQYAYRIAFVNKNGTASLGDAVSFLSERALQRRMAQDIAIDSLDLPVSPVYLDSTLSLTGGVLHVTSRWFNQCVVLLSDTTQMPALRAKSYVRSVAKVGYYSSPLHLRGSGAAPVTAGKPAGDASYYGQSWTQTNMVHGDALHDAGFHGAGKLIAVLDVGFLEVNTHTGLDSLRNSGRLVDQHNFVKNDSEVDVYSIHGTASLSTMAGYEPGLYVGSAPLSQYALYITDDYYAEQPIEEDMLIAGLERADSIGADIASMSLSYNIFDGPGVFGAYTKDSLNGHATLPARGVNTATTRGMLCVASAGNEGGNSWNFLCSPADADSVLSVAAVAPDRSPAFFSSPGPNASGVVKPDIAMMGDPAIVFLSFNMISGAGGTSFASPQAAGYAACLWQAVPTATPYQIRLAIQRSADRYTAPTAKLGYGIPDFGQALQFLSVPALATATEVAVGPVPFHERLFVTLPEAFTPYHISFYHINGALAWQGTAPAGRHEITSLQNLPTGLYLLKVTGEKGTVVKRVLKQ